MTKAILGFRAFGRAIWDVLGERRNPRIVFEHPGQDTIPTSIFVCDTGGMVVICAGTTGYNGDVDLRYLWTRQKRFQGSHFANDDEAARRQPARHRRQDRPLPDAASSPSTTSAWPTSSCTRTATPTATWRSSSAPPRPGPS